MLIKGQSTGPSISRLYQFLLPVTCGVNRKNQTVWLGTSPPEGSLGDEKDMNHFDMVIKVYKDQNFNQELSTPVRLPIGTPLYVELSVVKHKLSGGMRAKILVENCVALPFRGASDPNNKHLLIKDQAAFDDSTGILQSPAFHKVQFRMEIFKIPQNNELYLSCDGYVCPYSDNSVR